MRSGSSSSDATGLKASSASTRVGPLNQGRFSEGAHDVVAVTSRDRHDHAGGDADLVQVGPDFGGDVIEPVLRKLHHVHLVDDHGDLFDAEKVQQIGVAAGLLQGFPSPASITRSAASALEAPVTMFFRNSVWPGASMIT